MYWEVVATDDDTERPEFRMSHGGTRMTLSPGALNPLRDYAFSLYGELLFAEPLDATWEYGRWEGPQWSAEITVSDDRMLLTGKMTITTGGSFTIDRSALHVAIAGGSRRSVICASARSRCALSRRRWQHAGPSGLW